MRKKQHVAQTNRTGTIVLGQRVLVELGEGRGQTLLHLPDNGCRPSAQ
jgi:hypothetical protein